MATLSYMLSPLLFTTIIQHNIDIKLVFPRNRTRAANFVSYMYFACVRARTTIMLAEACCSANMCVLVSQRSTGNETVSLSLSE